MSTKTQIDITLRIIGLAGLTGIAIAAPNATQGLQSILRKSNKKNLDHKRIIAELKRQGLVHISQDQENLRYTVTPAGAHRLQQLMLDEINIEVPKKWDKKWRVVSFDVPTNQSKQRAAFTEKLRGYNFIMMQKSVWVHPAPCLNQLEQLASHYNIMRYCTLMEVSRLDEPSTKKLLRHYKTLTT